MSVSGIVNTHFIVAYMILQHGTEEQKQRYLPRMATGEIRGAFSMSEPGCGSDVSAIKTRAVKGDDGDWTINGQKMWLTNGGTANLVAVLVKTDTGADSVYRNMTTFLIDKESGFGETAQGITVPGKIEKMGYKGVDTTELILDNHRTSSAQILGGEPGKGFYQMMDGVEVGRVNVAARGCGVARRAFELGIAYAQQRETFGKKIVDHQAVLFRLADMAVKVEAAHEMMVKAARKKDSGRAQRPRGRHGEVPRLGELRPGRRGQLPDPRRLRLLEGVRDRAALPRGADAAHRRGHGRHPADDHRSTPRRGLQAQVVRSRGPVAGKCEDEAMSLQPKGPGGRPGFATLSLDYPMSLGTFDKYEDAQKAVDTLSDNGFPVENCLIVGTELKQVERVTARLTWGRVALGGALSGLWLGLFVGLIFSLFNPPTSAFALLLATRPVGCPVRSHLVAGRLCVHAWHA